MDVRASTVSPARAVGLYESGRLAECETLSRSLPARGNPWRLHALLALKRTKEVVEDATFRKLLDDPFHAIAVSLAWDLEGNKDEAAVWRERAAKSLDGKSTEFGRVAALLRATQPLRPDRDGTDHVRIGPTGAALAVLAGKFPARRAEYLATAAKYNVRRVLPSQLVKVAAEQWNPPGPSSTARR